MKREEIEQSKARLRQDGCTAWESRVYIHNKKKEVAVSGRRKFVRSCRRAEKVVDKVSW